ncbi:MAG: peptidoglycan DD-metalloendopeptidase family protein [Phaeodactylibacter sp.]|nr:peptidoglycan DD-metalloendopeptidase family protein [Phaeodactylibacter sp.]MCB9303970.1 peptidoglycan DD-metalloendopeptidase family protein [Lewinellaceae bacterium]HQU58195.1 peptidoglycan DD-metalloendopeptidase family protein [Saprospiraceae bacterium]
MILGTLYYFSSGLKQQLQASLVASERPAELGAFPITVPTIKYGFAIDTFQVFEKTIQSGQFLGDILIQQNMDYPSIEQLVRNASDVFDVRQFRVGNPFTILTKDSTQTADYLIYEPNVYEYIVFHLKGDLKAERIKREVTSEVKSAAGALETSLWNAIVGQGLSYDLADKMEDALQWSIDFHHLQKGDEFKLVYDQNFIEGEPVGIGSVHAAYYKTGENEYHAIYFDNGKESGYYDLEGRPMKRGFLKAPVKFSRISSYYNLNRFHPILKRVRPHFGTDYAAPYGTPIYAVGDGVIEKASYTNGNGNFVKIRHDGTYQTQYLHMQKFGPGIRTGVHVKQGQVIGYVGSSGLATGPHVCFRFWKDGKQVNHLNLKFPPAKPLPEADMPQFKMLRDQYLELLSQAKEVKVEEDGATTAKKGNP